MISRETQTMCSDKQTSISVMDGQMGLSSKLHLMILQLYTIKWVTFEEPQRIPYVVQVVVGGVGLQEESYDNEDLVIHIKAFLSH